MLSDNGSSFKMHINDYKKGHPELKHLLEIVGDLLTAGETLLKEERRRPAISSLPNREEIRAHFSHQRFALKEKDLPIEQDQFRGILSKLTTILEDTGIIPEPGTFSPTADFEKDAARLHLLDFGETDLAEKKAASKAKEPLRILHLILLYFSVRPFYKSLAEYIRQEVGFETWTAGCCPVCGQLPFLARLEEEDGAKFLACGLCDTSWRFPRLACPFCKSQNEPQIRYFYVPGEEGQRVYVCERCRTYLKTIEPAKLQRKPLLLFEHLVTPHLDLLAQKAGYFPPRNLISALVLARL
ncbi:MAG: formate dehydrogenase accessory protein FdhE [Bacillota bacterium]|jgi:FdhE protein|nr:formate dehydrogenase accessory protein FdhE [Bacillota bacterium]